MKLENKSFEVKDYHLKLLKRMYVGWHDCEFGAPEINPKRPYGNSDVVGDIAEIIGYDIKEDEDGYRDPNDEDQLTNIHLEMETVLQILVSNPKGISPGTYTSDWLGKDWHRA